LVQNLSFGFNELLLLTVFSFYYAAVEELDMGEWSNKVQMRLTR
jgi:hypothetical protein